MIDIEGRQFEVYQKKEAVAFLEGLLQDLERHAMVFIDDYGVLLDDHRQLQQILDNEPRFNLH